jgi:HAD superfamily hydrolase (TIGR01509 family)|nr:HAD family phosphatase [Methylomonas sp.]
MDGLVLDSESGYFAAWQQAAADMGYHLDQVFCLALSGSHGPAISQRLLARFGADFGLELFYRLSGQYWREQVRRVGIPVKTGFNQALQQIKSLGLPYCLATNSRRADAEQCLILAGLQEVFEQVLTREDVDHPKPAADIFIKAAEAIKIPPQLCRVLEDSPIGVRAAVAADCPCLYIPSVLPADSEASHLAYRVLPDLAAVADFISAGFDHPL